MTISVTLVGATGWVGRALVQAISTSADLKLVGAVARSAAGQDVGTAAGLGKSLGIAISASLAEALKTPSDVVVDYTKPNVAKTHALSAIEAGRSVVVGTSGLTADDYAEIDRASRAKGVGMLAAGNFSITATLMQRFALEAARYVADVEVIDYASATKPDVPSGTGRELAEKLGEVRRQGTATPVEKLFGAKATRGAEIGRTQVHSIRMPSFVLSCEALFGAPDERLTIRHDAGSSAAPYVAGTLLAIRKVAAKPGLRRGLDQILD